MPSTYIQRTPSGGNRKKWTWSGWIKLAKTSSADRYLWSGYSAANNTGYLQAYFHTDSQLTIGAWNTNYLNTTRLFRDVNAWYHIVIALDTAQATAANRLKLYVNGVEETAFDTDNRSSISQDSDMGYNSNGIHTIGGYQSSGSANGGWNGLMSHVHFTDGYAYTPSSFGETDATTGEWKINTSPSVSYGTTGYFIFKNDAGVTDQSPNSNNWTASGNLIPTQDSPSNIFNILNPIHPTAGNFTISNGATTIERSSAGNVGGYLGTIMPTTGKWYWEAKIIEAGNGDRGRVGVANYESITGTDTMQTMSNASGLEVSTKGAKFLVTVNGSTTEHTSSGDFSDGDIVNIAMDLDNKAIYVGRNGTYLTLTGSSGGDPTSGAAKTGAIVTDTTYILNGSPMCTYFGSSVGSGSDKTDVDFNFGNGYFGTTAVASAGTNASNNGIFEYDVPSGYTALCTKGLNL